MFDLHGVPCRIAVRPSTCLVNRVCRPSADASQRGQDTVKYSKTYRQLYHSISYIIIAILCTHANQLNQPNSTNPTQPTTTAFLSHQSEDRAGYGAVHTKFVIVDCVWFNQWRARCRTRPRSTNVFTVERDRNIDDRRPPAPPSPRRLGTQRRRFPADVHGGLETRL